MNLLPVSNNSLQFEAIPPAPSLDPLAQKIMEAARASWFSSGASLSSIKNEVAFIPPDQLKIVLDKIALEKDAKEILERVAQMLPAKKVQEALGIDPIDAAMELSQEAANYLKTIPEEPSLAVCARLSAYLDTALSVLESFLNAFGIAEFFKPAESKSDAKVKAQTMMMLLQFSILLSTLALPVFGPGTAGIVVGSILLSIWTLSIIYPYISRAPSTLIFAENWTRQHQLGNLAVGGGRKETVDEIARTLIASENVKTHALLLGKSGIGKTETAKVFVEAIERGDYPELKGKQVFYINTADLINKDEGTKILARINEAMGRHRKNIILIFDEIHIACQKRENSVLGDQLKTLLDVGKDKFQFVIGITTEEEFYRDIYTNNPAFARRFKRIPVDNTSSSETIRILTNALWKQAPKILVAHSAFETLVEKTKDAFGEEAAQPAASLKVLALCIKKTAESQKSPLEIRVEALREKIDSFSIRRNEKKVEIAALQEQLQQLGAQLVQEKEAIERLYQDRDRLCALRETMYRTAIKVTADGTEQEQNRFLLLKHLIAAMEPQILSGAERLGVKTVIDSKLIDEVIQEERENSDKAQRIIERARHTMSAQEEVVVKKSKK